MSMRAPLPALGVVLVLVASACRDGEPAARGTAQPGVAELLRGTDDTGFARATRPPELRFPRDHGAHPEYRTEWWYVTANVAADTGRRFGVQLVFFRQGMAAPGAVPQRPAALAAREVVLAHAAVTDVEGGRFRCEERLARVASGLAAVVADPAADRPFEIRCGDWSATAVGGAFLPLRLDAAGVDFSFQLVVGHGKPVVLQGDAGLSRKSDEPGNASIYYSMTRLPIRGTLMPDGPTGARLDVQGEAWLDREWSTSALALDQVGWDWFSLQLDDGTELMWYQLRRRDGSVDAWSRGSSIAADGRATPLGRDSVEAVPEGTWTAADGGARYPARWRLRTRGGTGTAEPFDLEVVPVLADQELRLMVRYWEGAVAIRGTRAGRPVTGRGYLEMTGYSPR
jgi:predicted secreted hydrolase